MTGMDWYCLRSAQGREFTVEVALLSEGIEAHCFRQRVDTRRSRFTRVVVEPAFPGYVFFRRSDKLASFDPVRHIRNVVEIVRQTYGADGARYPTRIPDSLIRSLQEREENGVLPSKHQYERGDRIRLKAGVLSGYEGSVEAVKNRILVYLDSGVRMQVRQRDIEPAA